MSCIVSYMPKIRFFVDKKAALLAGLDLENTVDIDVTPASIGEHWPRLIDACDTSKTPPVCHKHWGHSDFSNRPLKIAGDQATDVLVAIEKADAEMRERIRLQEQERAEREARLVQYQTEQAAELQAALAGPFPLTSKEISTHTLAVLSPGKASYPSNVVCLMPTPVKDWTYDGVYDANKPLKEAFIAKLKAERDAAITAATPAILAAIEEHLAQAEAQMLADTAARHARWAKRLETGYWEKETPGYNGKRYGAPWCAKVSFTNGAKPEYEWGDSTGKWGNPGLLRVECRPGDIIAWGQKDLRNPAKSEHTIAIMQENGHMETVTKTEAFRHWTATHK